MMYARTISALVLAAWLPACTAPRTERPPAPSVAPASPSAGTAIELDAEDPAPLYRELLAIDLQTAVRVAAAERVEVERARLRVEAAAGEYEGRAGALFPVLTPALVYESVDGKVRAIDGPLLAADFTSLAPSALLRWALNPGKAVYDLIAARRRLEASEHDERHARQEAVRCAASQYYDLVLAAARLGAAERALRESQESLRLTESRLRAGTGLGADRLLAEGALARRQQEVVRELDGLYRASIALALTLRLDPAVTLVPSAAEVPQLTLVDEARSLDELLALAVQWREDLASLRSLIEAAEAGSDAQGWQALGPQVDLGYQYGKISADTPGASFPLSEQERALAAISWNLSLATPGQLRAAAAGEATVALDAQRQFELVRAQVVRARQASASNAQLIPLARRELDGAEEHLKLARAGLRTGTALALEVLQAEEGVSRARLSLAEAVVRYNAAQVDLLASLGLIDEHSVVGDAARIAVLDAGDRSRP